MGFGVGVTTLKLANKVSSKARGSRTGKLRGVACEALKERWGKDPDIDRTLTPTNVYQGEFESGIALTEQLTKEAQEYSEARKAAGGRGLREDASIAYAVILKPDREAIVAMPPEQRERFFRDSQEILDGIFQSRCRARVRHRDEPDENGVVSEHEHSIYDGFCKDDGRLCVNDLVNPRIWKQINVEYPRKMREMGWDGIEHDGITLPRVDDCELYDEERAKTDEAYKAEREARRKDRGLTSEQYKRKARKADQDAREQEQDTRQADLDAQAVEQAAKDARQQRALQRISQEQVQVNSGRKQNDTVKAALNAREASLNAREAAFEARKGEIYQAAAQAAQAYLEGIEADKRRTAEAEAAAKEAARKAGEQAIHDAIDKAKGMPQQQWQRQSWQLGGP